MSAENLLILMLLVPLATAALALISPSMRLAEWVNVAGAAGILAVAVAVVAQISRHGAFDALRGSLYVDALSAIMIGSIALVSFSGAMISIPFIRTDLARGNVPQRERGVRFYYAGIHLFIATMIVTVCVDNLGLLWVGIEATTVASALLVGFSRRRAALDAAWKYVILCTVGITCALFGVMLTYFSARVGTGHGSLDWSTLAGPGNALDPELMRLAFIFILIGLGTKAGFAPLHTWMADAYGQAPSPVSGMLSGVLSSVALYGIMRFHVLASNAGESRFSSNLLLLFGVLSVVVALPFILLARDLKRLFAYSSVEHIGLMAIAFGIGGPLGMAAGIFHLMNHAATKAFLFFIAGGVRQRYGTRRIAAIKGMAKFEPLLAGLLVAGILSIVGVPPFGIFVSEFAIVSAGFHAGGRELAAVVAVIVTIALIFAGFFRHLIALVYGDGGKSPAQPAGATPVWRHWSGLTALAPLLVIMLLFGIHVPGPIQHLMNDVATILEPGAQEVAAK